MYTAAVVSFKDPDKSAYNDSIKAFEKFSPNFSTHPRVYMYGNGKVGMAIREKKMKIFLQNKKKPLKKNIKSRFLRMWMFFWKIS